MSGAFLAAQASAIPFACPGCGKVCRAAAAMAGRRAKCPGCGHAVGVPGGHVRRPGLRREGYWAIARRLAVALCVLARSGLDHLQVSLRGEPPLKATAGASSPPPARTAGR